MSNFWKAYKENFTGLSKEIWFLAAVTLLNRAGTMVVPFMALYMTESLSFTFGQVGWIMTAFGGGSLAGAWLGGRLTDRFGFYRVMITSLACTGILFILLQFVNGFKHFRWRHHFLSADGR